MSAYHLACKTHQPPLYSEEIAHTKRGLEAVRDIIENRQALLKVKDLDGIDIQYPATIAIRFFAEHPHCPIHIIDETGQEQPTREDA